jgi:hypothetical protein
VNNRIDCNECDECGKPLDGPRNSVSIAYPGSFHSGECASRGFERARKLIKFAKDMKRLTKAYQGGGTPANPELVAQDVMVFVCKLVESLEK